MSLNGCQSNEVTEALERFKEEWGDSMKEFTHTVTQLTLKIEQLVGLHEKVLKWLLIVVCALALGRGLLEIFQQIKV